MQTVSPFAQIYSELRSGNWLNRRRIVAYCIILLLLESIVLGGLALYSYGVLWDPPGPNTTDFISFYAAGRLAAAGQFLSVYNQPAHYLMEQQVLGFKTPYLAYYYPPVFLFICISISVFPYLVAFAIWILATLTGYLVGIRKILGENTSIIPFLAFPAVLLNIGIGQNALLTASLFAAATAAMGTRPFLAGLFFGALCYKPHFGLLIPVAVLAGREWRMLWGAMISVAGLIGLSVLIFGVETWHAWSAQIATAPNVFENGLVSFAGLVSPFAAIRLVGGSIPLAYMFQGLATSLALALIILVWRRPKNIAHRSMALASGTVIALPVILFYDLVTLAVALAWLVVDARRTGYYSWEKFCLGIIYLAPLCSLGYAHSFHIPVGFLASFLLFGLIFRRLTGFGLIPIRIGSDASDQGSALDPPKA